MDLTTLAIALLSGLVMFLFGYRTSDKSKKHRQTEKRLEDTKKAQEVRDEVETLDDTGLAERAARWLHRK